jgi:cytoskeletal protein RodZ
VIVLHESQQEQLKEISANLRKIRQEKSIRIEEIAAQTHIRLASLRALEDWRFEELPEPVFIQGFIRRYAEVLGLDGIALANNFQVNIFALESKTSQKSSGKNPDKNPGKNFALRLPPLLVLYMLLIVTASLGLVYLLKPKVTGKPLLKKQQSAGMNQQKIVSSALIPAIAPNPTSRNIPINPSKSTNKDGDHVVATLQLQGKSWLQIKADGKTEFAGTLNPGYRKTWTAKNDLSVRSGNAGAVWISINQQQPEVLGEDGEVKEVTYTNE